MTPVGSLTQAIIFGLFVVPWSLMEIITAGITTVTEFSA